MHVLLLFCTLSPHPTHTPRRRPWQCVCGSCSVLTFASHRGAYLAIGIPAVVQSLVARQPQPAQRRRRQAVEAWAEWGRLQGLGGGASLSAPNLCFQGYGTQPPPRTGAGEYGDCNPRGTAALMPLQRPGRSLAKIAMQGAKLMGVGETS